MAKTGLEFTVPENSTVLITPPGGLQFTKIEEPNDGKEEQKEKQEASERDGEQGTEGKQDSEGEVEKETEEILPSDVIVNWRQHWHEALPLTGKALAYVLHAHVSGLTSEIGRAHV